MSWTVYIDRTHLSGAPPSAVLPDVLPQSRRTTWNPGLNAVGGIPNVTNINSTLSPLSPGGGDSATITIASPAVVTVGVTVQSGQAFVFALNGDMLGQSGGTLPGGISIGTDYYALSTGTSFHFSTSPGGTAVNTTGTLSGSLSICQEDGPQINTAITNAAAVASASSLQVVKLNAGVYSIGAQPVVIHSPYVTLRGAGPGVGLNTGLCPIEPAVFQTSGTFAVDSAATQLVKCNRPLNDGNAVIDIGWDANFSDGIALGSSINLTADATKDAFSCSIASNPGLSVGEIVLVDMNTDNDPDVWWGLAHDPAMASFTGSITSNVLTVTAMAAGSGPIATATRLTISGGGLTLGVNHIVAQLTGDVYGVTISLASPCLVTLNSGTLASLGITSGMPFTFQNSGGSLPTFEVNGNPVGSSTVFYVVPVGSSTFNCNLYPESAQPLISATGSQSGTQSAAFGSATGVVPCTYSVDNSPSSVTSQALTAVGGTRRQFGRQDRSISQLMEVAGVSGTTVTFVTPFHMTFSVANQAQITRFDPGQSPVLTNVGLEEMFVWGGLGGNITFEHMAYSWIKHVESCWSVGDGISMGGCYRCTLRDSFVHETPNPDPGGGGYRLGFSLGSSDCLVENNISWCGNKVVVMRGGGSGNVFGYNYMDDSFGGTYPDSPEAGVNFAHMSCPSMNLAEGNYSHNFKGDSFWGASIYNTCHRNQWSALRAAHAPLATYNSTNPFKPYGDYINRIAVDVQAGSYNHNFIGNVLGIQGQTLLSYNANGYTSSQPGFIYENLTTFDVTNSVIMWKFGEEQDPAESVWVTNTIATQLRQGNWDWFTQKQRWHGIGGSGATDSSPPLPIPNSYYLSGAPSFFNGHPWPWVDPSTGTTYTLQAKARFNTSNPNDLTV